MSEIHEMSVVSNSLEIAEIIAWDINAEDNRRIIGYNNKSPRILALATGMQQQIEQQFRDFHGI